MKNLQSLISLPLTWLMLFALTVSLSTATEDDLKAKAVLSQYRDSVVTVRAVSELHVSAESGGRQKMMPERDIPITGMATVVGKDGILVSAYSYFDASSAVDGKTIKAPGGKKATVDVSVGAIKQARFLMRDGTEVPAEVLLKDAGLDLIVLRAEPEAWRKAGGDKLPAVDLTKSGEAELLDTLLVVGLSGPAFGRAPLASEAGVIVKAVKPRTTYRPTFALKGCPAFLLDGRLLGIGAQFLYRDKLINYTIIVPASDVAELVQQALAGLPANRTKTGKP